MNKNNTSNIPQLSHEYSTEEVAVLSTISVAIIATSLVLNILILLEYVCSRSTREKPSSILLVSMGFCQLATSSVVIPYQVVFQVIKPELAANGGASCIAPGSITYATYVVISETVLLMTVDRYFAVCLINKVQTHNDSKTNFGCSPLHVDPCFNNWNNRCTNWFHSSM